MDQDDLQDEKDNGGVNKDQLSDGKDKGDDNPQPDVAPQTKGPSDSELKNMANAILDDVFDKLVNECVDRVLAEDNTSANDPIMMWSVAQLSSWLQEILVMLWSMCSSRSLL